MNEFSQRKASAVWPDIEPIPTSIELRWSEGQRGSSDDESFSRTSNRNRNQFSPRLSAGVILDYDEAGNLISLEVLDPSKRVTLPKLH